MNSLPIMLLYFLTEISSIFHHFKKYCVSKQELLENNYSDNIAYLLLIGVVYLLHEENCQTLKHLPFAWDEGSLCVIP